MYDVFCYGAISLDISGRLTDLREEGYQAVATDYRISPGGDAALVAITLAGLGLKVALGGGPLGDDPMGEYLRNALKDLGVTLLASSFGKTTVATVLIGDKKRSVVTYHEESEESDIPVQEDTVKHSRYVYADGCYPRNSAIVGSIARTGHIPSLLNFDTPSVTNVSLFDTVIAAENPSRLLSEDAEKAAKHIYELNDGLAIVTQGEKGCVYCDGTIGHVPAFPVKAVDTTGAGAAFAAGFIFAQTSGKKTMECLRFASAAGAMKAVTRGSYRIFTPKEIERFIISYE